jgi:cell division protein FtsW (lipid II flippase)
MDIVLDVAFVLAVVAFLKKQFILDGNVVLVVAFLIALAVAAAPLIGGLVPAAAPWIKILLDTFVLFLGAAGSFDAVKSFTAKKA